jgi:carboxypeptidase D
LASVWGFYVWRDRRRRAGYEGLWGGSNGQLLRKRQGRDVEAVDFDESELDDLHVTSPNPQEDGIEERYSLGGDSDEEDIGKVNEKANGHANGTVNGKGKARYKDERND